MADALQIFASGLTGAVLTQAWNEARGFFNEKKEGKVAALFLSAELDSYATACAERRQDITNHEHSDGELGRAWRTIPELPAFSDKTNWRALGGDLTQQVLAFRAESKSQIAELEALWAILDGEDVIGRASDQCVEIGCEAVRLAAALRTKYKITPLAGSNRWNAAEFLRDEWTLILGKRRDYEANAKRRAEERATRSAAKPAQ